jgi:4-phospho-D-threonate 3-dehydrogenase / 4-phospho-D-erythronate 3-dehydrogenase
MSKLPRIAVTMGDPAGIGPELCLRLLTHGESARVAIPIVFGDAGVLRCVAERLSLPFTAPVISREDWPKESAGLDTPAVLDFAAIEVEAFVPGQVSAVCGEAAYRYVTGAIDAALAGQVEAVATAPLHKEALHAAGHDFPGHTEIFATRMRAERSCMMLTAPEITCSLVTVHVGLNEVPGLLTTARIREVIDLTAEAMRRMRGHEPRLAVCGLNPHAGEGGLFGRQEEERIIVPAVSAARASGLDIEGPLSPDTAFLPERRRRTDAYVCMYHDQGLIPLKALAFDSAINTTLGLPIVRTSVDHGTAFDIAWQGRANPASLYEAVRLAARLSQST